MWILLLVLGLLPWGCHAHTMPPLHPAASAQEQFEKINGHLGPKKMRVIFFWTTGIFGHGKSSMPLGNNLHQDFFTYLDEVLAHVPNLTAEVIMDDITHQGSLPECAALQKKYGKRFSNPLLEVRLAELHIEALDKALAHASLHDIDQLDSVINALENGLEGNPAIASDVARIWWLHHPDYPINMYIDIDTFVHNAKKLLLAEVLPKSPHPNNIIRRDLIKEGISNDLLATFNIKPEAFYRVRSDFVDKQLLDKERQQLLRTYKERKAALTAPIPIEAYKQAVKRTCDLLRNDYEEGQRTGTTRFMGGKDALHGMTLPIALLNIGGPAAPHGAQAFEQELYNGEKPSDNSWATFIWVPLQPMVQHKKLHELVSYLTDWNLFKKIGDKPFLKALAKEIVDLAPQIRENSPDGQTKIGLDCFQGAKTNEHSKGAYDALKSIFEDVKNTLSSTP